MANNLVQTSIVSKNDAVCEIHPDIVRLKSGKIICLYRESDTHDPVDFSHLIYRVSTDNGKNWGPRTVFAESQGKDRKFHCWKCPRISQLPDGRLVIISDILTDYESAATIRIAVNVLWWSSDEGLTWNGPKETSIRGIVPDKVALTAKGALITGTLHATESGETRVVTYRSEDGGDTWDGPSLVAAKRLSEPSIVVLKDGTLVCYLRNGEASSPGMKCISNDDGRTWQGPYPTPMPFVRGRPAGGVTATGAVLVTYRYGICDNYFAYLESQDSARNLDPADQKGRLFPLLHQSRGGGGYTGWAQLPDGQIYNVTAVHRDAPTYFIEAQQFREEDI